MVSFLLREALLSTVYCLLSTEKRRFDMKNKALFIAGTIFAIISLIHFVRLFYHFQIVIGSWSVPLWFSGMAFVIIGLLSAFMFRALRHEGSENRKP